MPNNAIQATATGLPKLTRRNLLAAAATTPLAALPVAAHVLDQQEFLDHTIAIAEQTGLSMDDLVYWFKGIDPVSLRQIKANIAKAPNNKWSYEQTRSAVTAVKTGEIFKSRMKAQNPILPYALRQIALKGDRLALKDNLAYFKEIKNYDGVLMEFA